MSHLPETIPNEEALDDILSVPSADLVDLVRNLEGDILVLGVAGKMGMTLSRMAGRVVEAAGISKKVTGVARFSDPANRRLLEDWGVGTIACDLLDREAVAALPDAANIIFMAGMKFGAEASLDLTWAMNVLLPSLVAERYAGSRIVAFSTGCVYPFVTPASLGCTEETPPAPVGEYAQSCLGRERVFGYGSQKHGTPVCLLRLNYAIDLRYGVLRDVASKVWHGEPVDLGMGWFNAIWQGDANNQALLALGHCSSPANVLNVTGPEMVSVRWLAEEFGRLMGRAPVLVGEESGTAYLNNAAHAAGLFGYPRVPMATLVRWTADWVKNGGRSLNKPTHFEVRDGKY